MLKTGLIALVVAGGLLFSLSAVIEASQPQAQAKEQVNWFSRVSSIPLRS